jgi:hypothetical protein
MEPRFIAKNTLSNKLIPSRTKRRNQWQYWILAPYHALGADALTGIDTAIIETV